MQHRTWVEINQSAIIKNIKGYKKILPKETALMAVVKANAYGHDLMVSSEAAIEAGADYLAVFTMDDALSLRKKYKDEAILVLKQVEEHELDTAVKNNIDITISSLEMLNKVAGYKKSADLLINLKIDTGLSRQGILYSEMQRVLSILEKSPNLNIVSLYTHLIGAENKKFDKYTKMQIGEIKKWQSAFNKNGYYPLLHASATSGYLMNRDMAFDVVRMGIGIYGLWPDNEVQKSASKWLSLTPALSWKTKVSEIKEINNGTVVGYNATFTAKNMMKVAILPVGYFDGLPRSMSGKGYMLCDGLKCPILGRVMMNMCVIDISKTKNIKAGDEVVIIGKQKKNSITADELAGFAGTINYEIVTRINGEIPRIAIK